MKILRIPAADDRLEDINTLLEEELGSVDCPMKILMQIQLSVEEIFVNIAHYAYGEGSGEAELTLVTAPGRFTMSFRDWGTPFDPLKKEDADVTLGVEERKIGGLGIFLVKKSMDEVHYTHEDGTNLLTIIKTWEYHR